MMATPLNVVKYFFLSCFLGFALLVLCLGNAEAANLPAGFAETQVAEGLDPTAMAFAPDGRLFITEKPGRVRIVKDGKMLPTPFLDIQTQVDTHNERGLQSVAFDPEFKRNHWLYIFYTRKEGARSFSRVARYTAKGDRASGKETVIIDFTDLTGAGNHNGGGLNFGVDGKLYVATGDDANGPNSQNPSNQLGKLMRLNKDGTIPTDNPNYHNPAFAGNSRAIVALGVRNGYSFEIHPETGVLLLNDVGNIFDEIHRYDTKATPVHRNFGWDAIDGKRGSEPAPAGYEDPVYAYDHGSGDGVAICGGDFYTPTRPGAEAFPNTYRGMYFFSDYKGWIKYIDPANPSVRLNFSTNANRPIDVEVAADGALWYIARGGIGGGSLMDNTSSNDGTLWRVRWTGAGQASRVAFTETPASVNAYDRITPAVRVAVKDAAGIEVPSSTALVTVALTPAASASDSQSKTDSAQLSGTTTVAAVKGVATFTDLSIDQAREAYTLTAVSPGLVPATSAQFDVHAVTATPVISPDGGDFSGPVWVQITSVNPTAILRYTTDGSAPTNKSPIYSAPFQITQSTTVRALAIRKGFRASAIAAASITVHGAKTYGMDYRPPVTSLVPTAFAASTADTTLPKTLSATGLFKTTSSLTPSPGVVPFSVNTAQWLDNAVAQRWIALTGTGKIGFSAAGNYTWPGGTLLAQHLEIAKTGGGTRRLETRVLVLDATGTTGYGVTYKWRADNSDADLVPAEGADEVLTNVDGAQTWRYPSRSQCVQCHTTNAGVVLGVKTAQLNRPFSYPDQRTDNQLRTWNYLQMFSRRIDETTIAEFPRMVDITDSSVTLAARVHSYLEVNCAGCHRPNGAGASFETRFEIPLEQQGIINGWLRNGMGIEHARVVAPKDTSRSILYQRMSQIGPAVQMPPLGHNLQDKIALDVIKQWIHQLPEKR